MAQSGPPQPKELNHGWTRMNADGDGVERQNEEEAGTGEHGDHGVSFSVASVRSCSKTVRRQNHGGQNHKPTGKPFNDNDFKHRTEGNEGNEDYADLFTVESVECRMGNGDFSGETRMSFNWMGKRLSLVVAGSLWNLLRHAGTKQKHAIMLTHLRLCVFCRV